MKIVRKRQKPVYSSNLTHLEISNYHSLSDKKFNGIAHLFPNIVHLDLNFSTGFSDKTLNRVAETYPNLKYLNLQKSRYECSNGGKVTDKGLCAIARSCHKLEYLNFYPILFTNHFPNIHPVILVKPFDIHQTTIPLQRKTIQ